MGGVSVTTTRRDDERDERNERRRKERTREETKTEVELYGPAGDRELDFEARAPLMGAGVGGSPLGKLV